MGDGPGGAVPPLRDGGTMISRSFDASTGTAAGETAGRVEPDVKNGQSRHLRQHDERLLFHADRINALTRQEHAVRGAGAAADRSARAARQLVTEHDDLQFPELAR